MKVTEDDRDLFCATDGELGHEKLKAGWDNHYLYGELVYSLGRGGGSKMDE